MSRAEDSYKIQRIASALRLISPSTELAGVLTEISNEIAAYLILRAWFEDAWSRYLTL